MVFSENRSFFLEVLCKIYLHLLFWWFLFIITGEDVTPCKNGFCEQCEELVKTHTVGFYQVAVWGLLRAWVWFIVTLLTGQLILWGSDRIKSTEQFSCVLHWPHILGAQITENLTKQQVCCSTFKALKIYGH